MRVHKDGWLAIIGVAVIPVVALSIGVAGADGSANHHHQALAAASPVSATGDAVVVDSRINETFDPTTPGTISSASRLTPKAAFRKFSRDGSDAPEGSQTQLGYLTFPVGGTDDQFIANHELVYAYTWTACEPNVGAAPRDDSTENPSFVAGRQCKQWLFVDALTGKMVDLTWSP